MVSPYIDVGITDAVRHAVNSIESQHNTFLSITLSVLLGVVCNMVVGEAFRHGMAVLYNATALSNLIAFSIVTLLAGPILIALICSPFISYGSTFTLVFDVANFCKNWRRIFIDILTEGYSYKHYHVYGKGCKETEYEYVVCHHFYKGSIPFTIKLQLFKATNVAPLVITVIVKPFKVVMATYYDALQRIKLRFCKRKEHYVELGIWYEVIEDLSFYFDEVKKALSHRGILLKDIVY
jgi:hypothetical protein